MVWYGIYRKREGRNATQKSQNASHHHNSLLLLLGRSSPALLERPNELQPGLLVAGPAAGVDAHAGRGAEHGGEDAEVALGPGPHFVVGRLPGPGLVGPVLAITIYGLGTTTI